jgi:hypothetical protein
MPTLFLFAALLVSTPVAGAGQDLPTTQVEDHGRVVLQDSTTRRLVNRSGARQARKPTAAQRSACAAKARFRARHGAGDARVRRLYALCRGVGL